jgi:hypothetical protein
MTGYASGHSGADEGRGIVNWSAIAGSRFRGRDPALQALDFVLEHGGLSDEEKEKIAGKFPLKSLGVSTFLWTMEK